MESHPQPYSANRPLALSTETWLELKQTFELPDRARVRVELELRHVACELGLELARLPPALETEELYRLTRMRVGDRLRFKLHPQVLSRLAGMATLGEDGTLAYYSKLADMRCKEEVTAELKWNAWLCLQMQPSDGINRRLIHGGPSKQAEVDFLCVLYNFWKYFLKRPIKNWSASR